MPTQWIESVKSSKQLTVFPSADVTQGSWASVFVRALLEFNRLSAAMKLGVALSTSTTAPETGGLGGANVKFDTVAGTVSDTVLGTTFSTDVSGTGMSAATKVIKWDDGNGVMRVIKGFCYLPRTPMVNTGAAGKQVQRLVGDEIKLFLAVHELIHACGLSNADHSQDADPDMFIGQPQPSPGNTPQDDRLRIRLQPLKLSPPLTISARTARLIQSVWG
jgi:hypothetical protein